MNLSAAYIKKQQEWLEEGSDRKGREVAIAALREGISPELIRKLTRLSLEEIENRKFGVMKVDRNFKH